MRSRLRVVRLAVMKAVRIVRGQITRRASETLKSTTAPAPVLCWSDSLGGSAYERAASRPVAVVLAPSCCARAAFVGGDENEAYRSHQVLNAVGRMLGEGWGAPTDR